MSTETNMMNCEDYKLAIAAEPDFDGGAEHVAQCADCQAYRHEMLAFDRKLKAAMDLAAPELSIPALPPVSVDNVGVDNVGVDNIAQFPVRQKSKLPTWLALAATVLIAAFVGVRLSNNDLPDVSLESQLLAHLDHEPYALKATNAAVSEERLARVVPAKIATMDHDAGLITYAQSCTINGHVVPHLVIQGKNGPITVLLMPEEMVSGASEINGEGVEGVILKVGDGSIAIIGEKDENLEEIRESVLGSVKWNSI